MKKNLAQHTRAFLMTAGVIATFATANVAQAICTVTYQNGGMVRQCSEQSQVGQGTQSGSNTIGGLPSGGGVPSIPQMPAMGGGVPSIPQMPAFGGGFDLSQLDSLFRQPQAQVNAPSIPSLPSLPAASSAPQGIPSFQMPQMDFSSFGNLSSLFSYLR